MPGFNPFRYRFPYTNINDINLDWIIKKVKALSDAVASIDISRMDEIAEQAETAQEDAETALATAQSAETTANSVQGIANNALTTAQSAQTTATQAATDAQTANNNALSAIDIGDNAATIARQARSEAQSAQTAATALDASKADKVQNATNGNFAALDANGNLTDSGHKNSDYAAYNLDINNASVGDLVRISAVDANNKPTAFTKVAINEIKCGDNMLDNWYFLNPVNQRGQSIYSNTDAYTIDRWKLTSGSMSVVDDGVTLNGTLVQILENAIGQMVVCSALLSDGTMINPTYDDNTKTFTLTATGQTIIAAKLELGSEQTLAHQKNGAWVLNEIPDYGQELAKCQRYLEADLFSIGAWPVANTYDTLIPYKVTKARTPTLTGSISYYGSSGWEAVPAQIEAPPESPLFGVRAYSPDNTAPANSIYRVEITASAEL